MWKIFQTTSPPKSPFVNTYWWERIHVGNLSHKRGILRAIWLYILAWSRTNHLNVKHVTSPLLERIVWSFTCLSIQESHSSVKNIILFVNHGVSFSGMLRYIKMKNPIGVHIVKSPLHLRVIWQVTSFNMNRNSNTYAHIAISHS